MFKILNLGRILFFSLLPLMVFANISASLDKIAVLKGEVATYTINAAGNKIKFPQLRTIEGFKILGTSTSSSISIINGEVKRVRSISYKFIPTHTFKMPIYAVIVDGVEYKTEEIKLKVIKPSSSKNTDDLHLELKLSKNETYVGEAIIASIYFRYKVGLPLLDVGLEEFNLKHFNIKQLQSQEPMEKDGYISIQQDFILTPTLAGKYNIPKQIIEVAKREFGTNMIRRQKIFSNETSINILPLPNGIFVQGDYKISASLDKTSVQSNEPVNLTLKIQGSGNIDDIDEFKLNLEDEIVYSSKPEIKAYLNQKKYSGTFTQKFSIVADKDYVIPSIDFTYFDKKTKIVKTIKTKSFNVKVKALKNTNPNIQTKQTQKVKTIQLPAKIIYKYEDSNIKYIYAIISLFVGMILSYFIFKEKNKKRQERPLEAKIKKAKNDKQLYTILLPYSFCHKIINIINLLEKNIYNNENNKINKKEIIKIMDEENLLNKEEER